jgi:Holliday junction resolvasome RuvABC endonuclease subunit
MPKILALDIATKTGWATTSASGTWDLKTRKGESPGMKHLRLKAKVKEVIELDNIDLVVYEKPSGRFIKGVMSVSELVGVILLLCAEMEIEHSGYTVSEVKKFATSKGNANKDDMMAAARLKWPQIELIDDNHSDALWILEMAEDEFNK